MKFILLSFYFFLLFHNVSLALHKTSVPGLYSTGVDDNYNLLAGSETDPHYSLILSSDNLFPGPDATEVQIPFPEVTV